MVGSQADRMVAPFMVLFLHLIKDQQWHDSETDELGSDAGVAGLRRERARGIAAPGALL